MRAPVLSRMRFTPGRKPRSAMWSASSSTVISTSSSVRCRWPSRSSSRPGHAMTMSTPAFSAVTWRDCATPPKIVVVFRPRACASGAIDSSIWLASSRVGASTRARGRPAARRGCPEAAERAPDIARRVTTGRANARVLPEPVRPRPSTSRPARESGREAVWMGNGEVMPRSARTRTTGAGRPRSAKVVKDGPLGLGGGASRAGGPPCSHRRESCSPGPGPRRRAACAAHDRTFSHVREQVAAAHVTSGVVLCGAWIPQRPAPPDRSPPSAT